MQIFRCCVLALFAFAVIASPDASFTVDDLLAYANVNIAALSDDGRWLAATSGTLRDRIGIDNARFGDPSYIPPAKADVWIVDTQSGQSQKLFADRKQVRGLAWSPAGDRLALLALSGSVFEPMIWERATARLRKVGLPETKAIADNSELQWSPDGSKLFVALRSADWRKAAADRFRQETEAPVVAHSSKEPFLAWEELRRMAMARSVFAYNVKTGESKEIVPEKKLSGFDLTEDGEALMLLEDITKKTEYDVIFGGESQVRVQPVSGGEAKTVLKSTKGLNLTWSRNGRSFAYSKDGNVFTGTLEGGEPKMLIGRKPAPEDKEKKEEETEADKERKAKERFTAVRLSPDGSRMVASNKEGLWLVDAASGERELFVKMPEEDKLGPRYQVLDWSPDGNLLYLSYASRVKWERGLFRYHVGTKTMEELWKDGRIYSAFRLSKDGSTMAFVASEGNRPGDVYAVSGDMKDPRRLTDVNPQMKQKTLARTELITYMDTDGKRLNGVLYYPAPYEAGKKYPMVVNVYEQFFDDTFTPIINVLTSNGYAVLQPSVEFETGFPGEAWLKGTTAAVNKVIEVGVADPDRLGIQGTSYGGYATNLLITQTSRFKAAINISGKVNMVSFYTDSPRLGIRNIHAPEKSQDRIGATLWQQPQKYIQHSAIMFADRIKTPLLLITGEQDHNVPARQAMEMYYALRRLNKEVAWVNYTNGGHGMPTTTEDEVRDYVKRILDWYETHLKKAAPKS